MFRRLFMTCAALVLLVPGTASAAPDGSDYQLPSRPADRLDLPATTDGIAGGSAAARARFRYAVSYVAIPLRGFRLGFNQRQVRAMTRRIGARMADRTDGRFTFGAVGYTKAPRTTTRRLSCNLDRIHRRYQGLAHRYDTPPRGYRDTIAVYLTPLRFRCQYAGVALLGGRAVYLNGVDLRDPQRLQDWIAAHELGHTLGLEHSAAFWSARPGWTWSDLVPQGRHEQEWDDYGDYLDLMGQPPKDGYQLFGARFGRWSFNSLSLSSLGVMARRNVTYIKASGTYTLRRLTPQVSGGRMLLAIPVIADGRRTFWVLEYRPPEENATTVNYPAPFSVRGYGVRLLLAPRGLDYPGYMNRLFRVSEMDNAPAALPIGVPLPLGGGARVTVIETTAETATVSVRLP